MAAAMPSQFLDFAQNIAVPGGTPDDVLTVFRPGAPENAFPENLAGDTVTLIAPGLLIRTDAGLYVHSIRANNMKDSQDFSGGEWILRGATLVNDKNQLAPDDTMTASTMSVGAAGVLDFFQQVNGFPAATQFEPSFFIKRSTTSGILRCQRTSVVDGQTGQWDIDMALLPDAWIRLTVNHPAVTEGAVFRSDTSAFTFIGMHFFTPDGVTRTFDIWGVQLEAKGGVSPYILTEGAFSTSILFSEITQTTSQMNFGTDQGTIVIDALMPPTTVLDDAYVFSISDNSITNSLTLSRKAGVWEVEHTIGGVSSTQVITGINDGTKQKIAFGWQADGNLNVSVDGGVVQTFPTQGGLDFTPEADFNLGSHPDGQFNLESTINSLTTYPDYTATLLRSRSDPGPAEASQILDFVANTGFSEGAVQSLDGILTVVRASEAWPENANGESIRQILANKLIINDGLFVSEQRKNSVPLSFDFTGWSGRGSAVVNDRNQLDPDGTFTASTIKVGATQGLDLFKVLTGISPSTNFELSFFIQRGSTSGIITAQRTSEVNGQTGNWQIDMALLPDRIVRLTKHHPAVTAVEDFKSGTDSGMGVFFFSPDGQERTFNLWGVQLEAGLTVSPHIPTFGGAVISFKDVITQSVIPMGFGPDAGMIVIDLVTPSVEDTTAAIFSISDGTANNALTLFKTSGVYQLFHSVAPGNIGKILTGINDKTRHKIAVGWEPDGTLSVSVDGGIVQSLPTSDGLNFTPEATFRLGANEVDALQLNSKIFSLSSYGDYSDALLQSRSTFRMRAIATNYYRRQRNG